MKKSYKIICLLLCFVFLKSESQNLVPNYSFENFTICPTGISSNIFYSNNWNNANVNGTTDYYNSCVPANPSYFGVPKNWCGYQNSKTGNGYIGAYFKTTPSTSGQYEYAQVQLMSPLKPNYYYCVQYFVSRADSVGDYAISNFGALFTSTLVNSSDPYNIQMTPQVKNPVGRFISSRKVWSDISGIFIAVGGEQYITIGNFDNPNSTDTLFDPKYSGTTLGMKGSIYYYIDDVTVEEVANAQAGRDSIINCGDTITLGADSAIGAYYTWTPNYALSNDSIAFPIANPSVSTTYVLKKQQCNVITYDTVVVSLSSPCSTPTVSTDTNTTIIIPNVFSPNADNVNDVFKIELYSATNVTFTIHNRWGNLIFEVASRASATEIFWDGRTTSGEPCTEGVYFYTLKYTDANGEQQAKNGYISLFR